MNEIIDAVLALKWHLLIIAMFVATVLWLERRA